VQPRRRRKRIGQLIWTPSLVEDYLRQTGALVDAVDRDWHAGRAADKVSDAQWKNWAEWLANWRKFHSDSKGLGTWSGGTADRAEQYRRELKSWREALKRLGGKLESPQVPREPTPIADSMGSLGRNLAIGAGIIGFGAVLLLTARASRATRY